MFEGHAGALDPRGRRPRRHGRRHALGAVALAAVTAIGVGVTTPLALASAAPATAAGSPPTTTTTVVSPTTTVTTAVGSGSTTTSTTTASAAPGSATSTTTTTVTPTTTTTTSVPARPVTTTTTTTVPVPPTTVPATVPAAASAPGPAPTVAAHVVPHFDTTCSRPATPGLQTYLDSLPAGSTFTSSVTACYLVPDGILLTRPITLVGGTFYDPTTTRAPGTVYSALKPIILIKDTAHVALTDISVLGANTTGVYHAPLVGQAGVKVMSSSDVSLTGITAKDTWGDGLELVADLTDHIHTPVTGLVVRGFTTIDAGRQGVTLAEVASSLLDHVNVVSPADSGFDFESDIGGLGSSNVIISNCTDDHGFNLIQFFSGPITVANCTGFHHVSLGSLNSNAPINFVGGSLICKRADPVPCIKQNGGSLTFTGVAISRTTGTIGISEPVWDVEGKGNLSFVRSPIASPMGSVVRPASVHFSN